MLINRTFKNALFNQIYANMLKSKLNIINAIYMYYKF